MKAQHTHNEKVTLPYDAGLPHSLHASELLHRVEMNKLKYQQLMDAKNERRDRQERLKPLFMMIGLTLSLLLVTIAINWRSYDRGGLVDLGQIESEFDDILEVPISEQTPPPPPQQVTEVIELVAVANDVELEELDLNLDVEMTEGQIIQEVVFAPPAEIEEEKAEEIFAVVETWPEPVGGMLAFYKYIAENLSYPPSAARIGIQGMVFVRFVVEKDGKITDVTVVKGIGAGCDEEAVRVIESAPAWNPGKQRGRAVRVYMTVPIRFILQNRD